MSPKIELICIPPSYINPQDYNTSFHPLPSPSPSHPRPTEQPQRFSRWLPLIASSQRIPSSHIQIITLTPSQARLLVAAAEGSIQAREINRVWAEELREEIEPLFRGLNFRDGLWCKLDKASPRDGVGGVAPLRSACEVVRRLVTSLRARNAIVASLDELSLEKGDRRKGVDIFFLPWNKEMRTENEYRIFCKPGGEITGVSQYKWFAPSVLPRPGQGLEEIVERIMKNIKRIHGDILRSLDGRDEMDGLLLRQGFSFDILWKEQEGKCLLIELNGFGATSGTGSCLFHWIRDRDVLYAVGDGERKVEFRISMEP